MRILILILAFHLPKAFAVKDLMALCERRLAVDSATEIPLAANQVAFRGPLQALQEPGMPIPVGWLVNDDFSRKNLSSRPSEYKGFVIPGDQVFILNDDGTVKITGFFGLRPEQKIVTMGPMRFQIVANMPYLFQDREMTVPLTAKDEALGYFQNMANAVVVKTVPANVIGPLLTMMKPWFEKYAANKSNPDRFVRVGRRRAFELAHFQIGHHGKAVVESRVQKIQIPGPMGEPLEGPELTINNYKFASGEQSLDLNDGDYLILLNGEGLVTYEGFVGTKQFPFFAEDPKVMNDVAAKIRASHSAFAAKSTLVPAPAPGK